MLKSMTAYGHACLVCHLGRFNAEIQSVNKKHLEINAFLPKEFIRFDAEIKKWIALVIPRGQVTLRITALFEETPPFNVRPNLPLARQLQQAWEAIAKDLNLAPQHGFKLEMLANVQNMITFEEDLKQQDKVRDVLRNLLNMALEKLLEMKSVEGSALHSDIDSRLLQIQGNIERIALKAPEATKRYRQKLLGRIAEVAQCTPETEERILREVCLYADRIDISEEITRFQSHIQQARELLGSTAKSAGKPLEFLLQEMNREVNTIGSKSSDLEVAHLVVDIKCELERIREQVQNIE